MLVFSTIFQISCKKNIEEKFPSQKTEESDTYSRNPDANCNLNTTVCEDCAYQESIDDDTANSPTILGSVYNNPYSIANMTAAFNYIYTSSIPQITTTHYYIRLKPTSVNQLNILDSLNLELYDYPLNRHVVQDGDYWPDAYIGLSQNEYPWFYTVVEINFALPSGIQTEILEPLHIPSDNEVLEDEAFYISNNSVCDSSSYPALRSERKEYYRLAPIDPCDFGAIGGCSGGGGTGGGSNSTLKPKGQISFKTYSTNPGGRLGASAPLRYAKVVARRFLKIDKTYTDENGNFRFLKRFPRKVTLIVKFKASVAHGQHSVRVNFVESGFWRSMFPLRKLLGTYKGNNLQNINYEFQKGDNSIKRKTKQWMAAVIMNTTEESRLFIAENNMQQLPEDLRLYLYAPQEQLINNPQYDFLRRSNAPFLNQDRTLFNAIIDFTGAVIAAAVTVILATASSTTPGGIAFISSFGAALTFNTIPHKPDVYFYYKTSDINSLTATKVSMSAGQQIGIVYLYNLTDNSPSSGPNRGHYLNSRYYAMEHYTFDTYAPFGNGIPASSSTTNYNPGIVSIWESFAQHFGHTMSDRIYGIGANNFELQGKQWVSDFNKSSNQKYLEEFDPQISAPVDYFNWIPVGLINDLMDTGEPPSSLVVDNVSGFTYNEIQSALFQKPSDMAQFKGLLQAIRPSQSVQISQLFASYGY